METLGTDSTRPGALRVAVVDTWILLWSGPMSCVLTLFASANAMVLPPAAGKKDLPPGANQSVMPVAMPALAEDPPVATFRRQQMPPLPAASAPAWRMPEGIDAESRDWLRRLRAEGSEREQALEELREVLLRAARFEVARRRARMPQLRGG